MNEDITMRFKKILATPYVFAIPMAVYGCEIEFTANEAHAQTAFASDVDCAHTKGALFKGTAKVIDGDTLDVHVGGCAKMRVRLSGIDTPERNQPALVDGQEVPHGEQVRNALREYIEGRTIELEVQSIDKYGRIIGKVTSRGRDLSEWLVSEGHAIAYYTDTYLQAEREARANNKGMWGFDDAYEPTHWRKDTPDRVSLLDRPTPLDNVWRR